ncbi:MAG TPA: amidohydrolase family protein [Candidatus Binataceae bacterium]|jgi:predicted TIM-barrel fold metal-dependent hydrolase
MPYAEGRIYNDADSHIMETFDWLVSYADPDMRDRIKPMSVQMAGGKATADLVGALPGIIERRRRDSEAMSRAEAKILERKSWHALGGFDPAERKRALDLLGYNRQLVFTGCAPGQFWGYGGIDQFGSEVLYGGARAHNRAIADFCSHDKRLMAVGFVPLDVPELAEREIAEAIRLGCAAIWVPAIPPPTMSPTHPDMDRVWARLQEEDVPFVLHLGGGPLFLREGFLKNGKKIEAGPLGGPDEIRSKDYMVMHYPAEAFLSAMILDGVLEKFPRLRGGVVEQGAMWVVPWLHKLDIAQAAFVRFEPYLNLPLKPSEYVHRQLKFTPLPPEPVGWMIEQAGADLFLFSTDFPHPEGGRDPLKRFANSLAGTGEEAKDRFYARNFVELIGSRAA